MTKVTLRLSTLAISLALLTAGFGTFTQAAAASSVQKKTLTADIGGVPDPTCDGGCMVAVHSS